MVGQKLEKSRYIRNCLTDFDEISDLAMRYTWDLRNSMAVKISRIWKFKMAAGKSKYHHVTVVVNFDGWLVGLFVCINIWRLTHFRFRRAHLSHAHISVMNKILKFRPS